jgi:quercetin dioxygenase-like cupin family protein
MQATITREEIAHFVDPENVETINVLGPTVRLLTPPAADDAAPCLMRGTIPPGVVIPLHSHSDPETFIAGSGEVDGLIDRDGVFEWVGITPGDIFHIPGGTKHAFRNRSRAPAEVTIVTTSKIGRFFREVGTPVRAGGRPPGAPSGETIRHFLDTAARYGYWSASPEENEQIGLAVPLP